MAPDTDCTVLITRLATVRRGSLRPFNLLLVFLPTWSVNPVLLRWKVGEFGQTQLCFTTSGQERLHVFFLTSWTEWTESEHVVHADVPLHMAHRTID